MRAASDQNQKNIACDLGTKAILIQEYNTFVPQ